MSLALYEPFIILHPNKYKGKKLTGKKQNGRNTHPQGCIFFAQTHLLSGFDTFYLLFGTPDSKI